jgi:hypothetical protein
VTGVPPASTTMWCSFRSTSFTVPVTCSSTAPRACGAESWTGAAFFGEEEVDGVETGGRRPEGSSPPPWASAGADARTASSAEAARIMEPS